MLEKYCNVNKLSVNIDKTKIVIFQKRGSTSKSFKFFYNKSVVEIVKNYIYLGVDFTQTGSFELATKNFLSRAQFNSNLSFIYKNKIDSLYTAKKLFNSPVSSIVFHVDANWSLNHLKVIEKLQYSFFKNPLKLPKNTSNYSLRLETGNTKLACKLFRNTLNWLDQIRSMEETRLPKICFKKVISIAKINPGCDTRYNWVLRLNDNFFKTISMHDFLNIINSNKLKNCKDFYINKLKRSFLAENYI